MTENFFHFRGKIEFLERFIRAGVYVIYGINGKHRKDDLEVIQTARTGLVLDNDTSSPIILP